MTTRVVPAPVRCCAAALVALFGAPLAEAGTINVPADAPSLSAAIAAARSGDVILVADGTWKGPANRNLLIEGKDLVVRSAHGPLKCILDCEKQARAFDLEDCGPQTIIEGFTIRHGMAGSGFSAGEGLLIAGGAPVVRDCIVDSCGFTYDGPDYGPNGGGLALSDSDARIENCTFTSNAAEDGGAINALRGSPTVIRCTFRNNSGEAHIEQGIPVGGFWEGKGGALDLLSCEQATVADCVFDDNESVTTAGAIAVSQFTGKASKGRISHCTFVRNKAGVDSFGSTHPGQVIEVSGSAAAGLLWEIDHCIVWENVATNSAIKGPVNGFKVGSSDVQGGYAGAGNLVKNPKFVNLAAGNVRLAEGSPCIDVGPPGALPFGGDSDLDHVSRLLDGNLDGKLALDMGAYERTNVVLTVSGIPAAGGTLALNVAGQTGLQFVVAISFSPASTPQLLHGLGYELVELGDPWRLVAGPASIPGSTTLTIPASTPPGTSFYLQPVAWDPTQAAGNFGAPAVVIVP